MARGRNIAVWINLEELQQLSQAAGDRRQALIREMKQVGGVQCLGDARSIKADLTGYLRAYDVTAAVEKRIDQCLNQVETE